MARRVDEEIVILDVASGQYYGLNAVGAFIWDLLETERNRDELVAAVVDTFDVAADVAAADIDDLLGELEGRGLIEW